MSRSVVTFIKTSASLEDFVESLQDDLRVEFVRNVDEELGLYEARFFGLFVSVYECEGYDDEGDLDFSSFDLVISLVDDARRIPPEYRDQCTDAISVMLVYVFLLNKIDAFMITSDVQTIIMRG